MLGNQFAVDLDRLHIQQHEQHPAWLLFIQVLPLVHAAPVDTCPSDILVVSKEDRYELKREREKKKMGLAVLVSPGSITLFSPLSSESSNFPSITTP